MEQYQKICDVGSGAYGEVYKALDTVTKRIVAVKRMKQQYSSWDACVQLREVKSLLSLTKSPHVVKLYEVIQHTNTNELSFIFEFVDGGTLLDVISEARRLGTPLDERLIKVYMYQTFQGIAYIHRSGYFHRDIKPENIFVSKSPNKNYTTIKVGDLGLAKEIRGRFPQTPYQGTRWYRAPELLLRDPGYTYKIDSFAMGCVMFELFALQPLFPGTSELDMLHKIVAFAGSPTSWPESNKLAEKIGFKFQTNSSGMSLSSFASDSNLMTDKDKFKKALRNRLAVYAGLISENAIDLMAGLLVWNPNERLSAVQALKHPFFSDVYKSVNGVSQAILNSGQCMCPECYKIGGNSIINSESTSVSASRGSTISSSRQNTIIDFDALENLLTGEGSRTTSTLSLNSNEVKNNQLPLIAGSNTPPATNINLNKKIYTDNIRNKELIKPLQEKKGSSVFDDILSNDNYLDILQIDFENEAKNKKTNIQNKQYETKKSMSPLANVSTEQANQRDKCKKTNSVFTEFDSFDVESVDSLFIDNDNKSNNNKNENKYQNNDNSNKYSIKYTYKNGVPLTNSSSGFKNKSISFSDKNEGNLSTPQDESKISQQSNTNSRPKTTKELLQDTDFNIENMDFFDNI